jgi:hypothetical protein
MYSGISPTGNVWHQVQRNDGNTAVYNLLLQPSGGNVGIGTTGPAAKLHIKESSSSSSQIRMSAASNEANYAYFTMSDNTVNTSRLTIGTTYGYNTPVDAITIFNGLVGIGTTNASYKLDVSGTFHSSGNATFNGTNFTVNSSFSYIGNNTTDLVSIAGNTMYFPGNGRVGIGTTSPLFKLHAQNDLNTSAENWIINIQNNNNEVNTPTAGIRFNVGDAQSNKAGIIFKRTAGYGVGDLYFLNNGTIDDSVPTIASNTAMVIKSSGNIGIGATSPTKKLHVVNEAFIGNSGGTTGLILYGDTNSRIDFRSGSASTGQITCGNSSNLFIDALDSRAIELAIAGTTVFEVSNSANVGIGTAGSVDPSALLEVKSNTQGFLPPRMDEAERDAIGGPAIGLMVFNLGTDEINVYTGAGWKRIQYI